MFAVVDGFITRAADILPELSLKKEQLRLACDQMAAKSPKYQEAEKTIKKIRQTSADDPAAVRITSGADLGPLKPRRAKTNAKRKLDDHVAMVGKRMRVGSERAWVEPASDHDNEAQDRPRHQRQKVVF